MLGLAPAREGDLSLDLAAWWRRDVERLIEARRAGGNTGDPKPALLWCLDWPEGRQLTLDDVDPWFIEVCRRVRLGLPNGRLAAQRSTSRKAADRFTVVPGRHRRPMGARPRAGAQEPDAGQRGF